MHVRRFKPPAPRKRDRLAEIAAECDQQEEGRVQKWLDLAKSFFDNDQDGDPAPSPA